LRRDGKTLRVIFFRPSAGTALEAALRGTTAIDLRPGEAVRWDTLGEETVCVVRLHAVPAGTEAAATDAAAAL
jgi:hypothetical protein